MPSISSPLISGAISPTAKPPSGPDNRDCHTKAVTAATSNSAPARNVTTACPVGRTCVFGAGRRAGRSERRVPLPSAVALLGGANIASQCGQRSLLAGAGGARSSRALHSGQVIWIRDTLKLRRDDNGESPASIARRPRSPQGIAADARAGLVGCRPNRED